MVTSNFDRNSAFLKLGLLFVQSKKCLAASNHFSKNLYSVGWATLCFKSEVMLSVHAYFTCQFLDSNKNCDKKTLRDTEQKKCNEYVVNDVICT